MLRIFRNTGKPCANIPQNPITPSMILDSYLRGDIDASSLAAQPLQDCPAEDDWSLPISSRKGVERSDLYAAQKEVELKKQSVIKERKEALRAKRIEEQERKEFFEKLKNV